MVQVWEVACSTRLDRDMRIKILRRCWDVTRPTALAASDVTRPTALAASDVNETAMQRSKKCAASVDVVWCENKCVSVCVWCVQTWSAAPLPEAKLGLVPFVIFARLVLLLLLLLLVLRVRRGRQGLAASLVSGGGGF